MRLTLALLLASSALIPAAQAQAPAPGTPATASSMITPALDRLRTTLGNLRLDKWKAPGPVREEASSNIGSINRDLDATLPGLLATADAAPGVVSKTLPVFRNVDALYDVLLRVVETADLSAPEVETGNLHQALSTLDDARRSLGDSIETAAVAQEQQIASIASRSAAAPAAAPAETVVNDGAATRPTYKHKQAIRKPVTPPPAATSPQP